MTGQEAPESRAVLIGVHDFEHLPALDGVRHNIPALQAQLTHPDIGGLTEEHCRALPADCPPGDILDAVQRAADEATHLLLVYYAGHGLFDRDGRSLLLATHKAHVASPHRSVRYAELREYVAESQARHKVVIIDCCFSGAALPMGAQEPSPVLEALDIEGAGVLTSAADTEESLCLPDGSVFTLQLARLLREGIKGPLPGGRLGEEQPLLTMGDVFAVLKNRLSGRREAGNRLVPQPRMASRDDGHLIPLAKNKAFDRVPAQVTPVPSAQPVRSDPDPLAAVVDQPDLVDGLGGFKKNLTPEHLPFLSPGEDHEADPHRLFARLRDNDERGVLLIGSAGTGKTRTGLEVGRIALEEGWRVLHVLPGRESSITDQINQHVLAQDGPALVVIDYLNEYLTDRDAHGAPLDLAVLRHRLLPAARRRGIRVAFLASVRPGWLQKADHTQLHDLFDEVELRQDEDFQRLVADHALTSLAPTAIAEYGMDRMREICGHRPIITLLVARELERRVVQDLPIPETAGLRASGELPRWLRSRLEEDDLTVPGRTNTFDRVTASDSLVAAAAAAAACPQPYAEVTAAANAALSRTPSAALRADGVVDTLIDLGWLERDGDTGILSTAHDVVCDQLVESVILPEQRRGPDRDRSYVLLSGCLTGPRTVGRYATNIGRVMNDLAPARRADEVAAVLDTWFVANTGAIGDVMRLNADIGGYALGAICSGAPWSRVAVQNWQQVVGPWLDEFGDTVDARHVLYRGLRNLPADAALLFLPAALKWLDTHGWRPEASYVLGPLLGRPDLPPEQQKPALGNALGWLRRNGAALDAHFVLRALVARDDLTAPQTRQVVAAALLWAERDTGIREAIHVLPALVARDDLNHDEARRTVQATLDWLQRRGTTPEPDKALSSVLSRTDLTEDEGRQAAALALEWLDSHATAPSATYLLRPLLTRTGTDKSQSDRAVDLAERWLGHHATAPEADFLIRRLLSRTDLTEDETRRAVGYADRWLEHHATVWDADFLIGQLLSRTDLTEDETRRAVGHAGQWLAEHGTALAATHALKTLLDRDDLRGAPAQEAIEAATTWLRHHADSDTAGYVLRPLLDRNDLSGEQARRAAETASRWAVARAEQFETSFTLDRLLARDDLTAEHARRAVTAALSWLGWHGRKIAGDYVLRSLLLRPELTAAQVRDATAFAVRWLDFHGADGRAGRVLGALLHRPDLSAPPARRAIASGLLWLTSYLNVSEADTVLRALLDRDDLTPGERGQALGFVTRRQEQYGSDETLKREAAELLHRLAPRDATDAERARQDLDSATTWLEQHADLPEAARVLGATVVHQELTEDRFRHVVGLAMAWLERHATQPDASYLLQPLMRVGGLGDDDLDLTAGYAVQWLEHHLDSGQVTFTLGPLISNRRIRPDRFDTGITLAARWLEQRFATPNARFVLDKLLGRKEITGDRARATVAFTDLWLRQHAAMREARFVLTPLLARTDLTPAEVRQAVTHALQWLHGNGTTYTARHVLVPLNAQQRLTAHEIDQAIDVTLSWLHRYGAPRETHAVLLPFLKRADLGPEQVHRLTQFTLQWIRGRQLAECRREVSLLAARTDLSPKQTRQVISLVVDSVQLDPTAQDVSFLLAAYAPRPGLTAQQRAAAVAWSLTWLEHHASEWRARFVLEALLRLPDLAPAAAGRTAAWTLAWLDEHVDTGGDSAEDTAGEGTGAAGSKGGGGFAETATDTLLEALLARPDLGADDTRRAQAFLRPA